MNITTITNEPKRGCGFRKAGGLYLRTDGISVPCGRLPLILSVCPCCGNGIKQARGWTWIGAKSLFAGRHCIYGQSTSKDCDGTCPLSVQRIPERAGLVWIGERYYKSPQDWQNEAMLMGVSRRVPAIPQGFKVGETLVLVAHPAYRKGVRCNCVREDNGAGKFSEPDSDCRECNGNGVYDVAAIFHAFTPTRIEYIVIGTETEEELERLEKRGITLVRLVRTDGNK